ncbi:RHS domain-containing protein [Acidovorax sp. NPDC077693]|uniref:RHS domain-containing protein n=1 Tax=Acidovorax sp. NPDC077693 TaxID=3363889 RepID=UPI0037CB856A
MTDHLGTPIALVNANGQAAGQVIWVAGYGAWGRSSRSKTPAASINPPLTGAAALCGDRAALQPV